MSAWPIFTLINTPYIKKISFCPKIKFFLVIVEASFMMMNQVDSSSFDDDKDDDKKLKRMISRLSQQVQDQV